MNARRALFVCLALVLPYGSHADMPLLEQALRRMEQIDMENWRYTRTLETPDEVRVDRHDPTEPGTKHWKLVAIDGRAPTEKELRDYAKDRSNHSIRRETRTNSGRIVEAFEPESLALISSDDQGATYAFRLRSPDGKRKSAWKRIEGELHVSRNDGDPFVDHARLWNIDSFSARFGVQINTFAAEARFRLEGRDVLPQSLDLRFDGRALFVIGFARDWAFRFQDLELVGEPQEMERAAAGTAPGEKR